MSYVNCGYCWAAAHIDRIGTSAGHPGPTWGSGSGHMLFFQLSF